MIFGLNPESLTHLSHGDLQIITWTIVHTVDLRNSRCSLQTVSCVFGQVHNGVQSFTTIIDPTDL